MAGATRPKRRALQNCLLVWWDKYISTSLFSSPSPPILANNPDLVGTVPIWRPKPDVPPDDPEKLIRPDLSRSMPQNTILNLPFACSLCSSVGIQASSVSFGLFSCTRPWWAVIQTKNPYILGHCSQRFFIGHILTTQKSWFVPICPDQCPKTRF